MKILENQARFHQLETAKMSPKTISEISANNTEIQTTFHQMEVPGMEEFLFKLKTQSRTTDLSEYGDATAISMNNLPDDTAA